MPTPLLPHLQVQPLPYHDLLPLRDTRTLDTVVVHCTELPDLAMARAYGEKPLYGSGTGNSGHFYIDRSGSAYQYVGVDRVAHHVRGLNANSIGIELVNTGRYPDWFDSRRQAMTEAYPDAQIAVLVRLVNVLCDRFPSLRFIAGHDELDLERVPASDDPSVSVARKRDPGPLFPWTAVMQAIPLQRLPTPPSQG